MLRAMAIINIFTLSVWGSTLDVRIWRLHVYRRQILTFKDVPRSGPVNINPYPADFFRLFFIHLKLELLTQFPAPNDEKKKNIYEKIYVFKM